MTNLPASATEPDAGRVSGQHSSPPALPLPPGPWRWPPCSVAQRLRDRGRIEAARAATLSGRRRSHRRVRWQPVPLGHGDAGLAVAAPTWTRPAEGWDRTGHGYLSVAAGQAEQRPDLPPALWGGMAGLGFAAWTSSRGGTRYQRLLASVDQALLPQVTHQAHRLSGLRTGMPFGEFDVISGLAGVGGYLLCRAKK